MELVRPGREVSRLRLAVILGAGALVGCTTSSSASSPPPSASPPPTASAPTAAPEYPGRTHAPSDIVAVFHHPVDPGIRPEDAARAIALALADTRVEARLAGARYRVLYVSAPPDPSELSKEIDPQTLPEVIVYDYSADRWLAIPVDLATGGVGAFKERDPETDGQPPIVAAEAERAVSLALADPAVTALMLRGFELIERPVRVGGIGGVSCLTSRCVFVILHDKTTGRSAGAQVDVGAELVFGVSDL